MVPASAEDARISDLSLPALSALVPLGQIIRPCGELTFPAIFFEMTPPFGVLD